MHGTGGTVQAEFHLIFCHVSGTNHVYRDLIKANITSLIYRKCIKPLANLTGVS